MMIMRWMCGVTKKDKIINEHVSRLVIVAPMTQKIPKKRLKVVRTYQEKRRTTRDKKHGRCTSRKETDRNTENHIERLL